MCSFEHFHSLYTIVTNIDDLFKRAILFWEERARLRLVELWDVSTDRAALQSHEYLIRALRLYSEQQYEETIALIYDVLDVHRERSDVMNPTYATVVLSRALGLKQRWRESIDVVERTLDSGDPATAEERMALHFRLGIAHMYDGDLQQAMRALSHAHTLSVEHGMTSVEPQIYSVMATVTLRTGDSVKAIGMYEHALLSLVKWPEYEAECNRMRINLASVLQHVGRERDALDIYDRLLRHPSIVTNAQLVMPIRLNMAIAYKGLQLYEESAACYAIALDVARANAHIDFQMRSLMGMAGLQLLDSDVSQAHTSIDQALALADHQEHTPLYAELQATKASIEAADEEQLPNAIERMKSAIGLMLDMHDSKSTILYSAELINWLAKCERYEEAYDVQIKCSQLERAIYEKEIERTTELSAVRTGLEVERAAIQQRDEERNRILHVVLPESIAERMMMGETHIADHIESVTIMFADIVGFTKLASTMEPEALVAMLEELFTAFDAVAEIYGCERLKTIGDSYMAICRSSTDTSDHSEHIERMCRMAIAMIDGTTPLPFEATKLRIGIHTGAVIAGVMRGTRLSYDVWGDTVNVAARMEEHSLPGCILCSGIVADALRDRRDLRFEQREPLDIQGKGLMTTYWLTTST